MIIERYSREILCVFVMERTDSFAVVIIDRYSEEILCVFVMERTDSVLL